MLINNIILNYNIPFISHALLNYEINPNYGNIIIDTINDFKKISLNKNYDFSEFNNYCNKYLNYYNANNKFPNIYKYTDDFIIINIGIEGHAVSLIINNKNKLIILVNTGYNIEKHHKYEDDTWCCFKIFSEICYNNLLLIIKEIHFINKQNNVDISYNIKLLRNENKSISIYKYNELYFLLNFINIKQYSSKNNIYEDICIYLKNISQTNENQINNHNEVLTYDISKYLLLYIYSDNVLNIAYDKYNQDKYDYNIFKINNLNQKAGSCTFHSILMCFYYIYYIDMPHEYNNKFELLKINMETCLLEYLSTIKLDYFNKYIYNNDKYDNQLILSLFKIINRKYNNRLINNIKNYNNFNIKYNNLILSVGQERNPISDYKKCEFTNVNFNINKNIFRHMINYLEDNKLLQNNLLNALTNLILLNYYVVGCINNTNHTEYINFIFNKNINKDNNVLYFMYYIIFNETDYIDNELQYYNSYIIHFMKNTTNFKITNIDNFRSFLMCIYYILYTKFSSKILLSNNQRRTGCNVYILTQLLIIFLKVLKDNENDIFIKEIKSVEDEFIINIEIINNIYVSDFNDKFILSKLLHYFKIITPLNLNYESVLYSLLTYHYKCVYNLINYILLHYLINNVILLKYNNDKYKNFMFPLIYSKKEIKLLDFIYYLKTKFISIRDINIKAFYEDTSNIDYENPPTKESKTTFKNPKGSIYFEEYDLQFLDSNLKLIDYDTLLLHSNIDFYINNIDEISEEYHEINCKDETDYSIYNYPKLLLENNSTINDSILYKNFEKIKLPIIYDKILDDKLINDFLISNYIDETNNFYYEEYKDFIEHFNKLNFDNLKIYNINTLFLVYIQYHYYYHEIQKEYFSNHNYLKLRNYLIINFMNKKKNNKYFFNEINFNFNSINIHNSNYILILRKINDYDKIYASILHEKLILKYNIVNYKYKDYKYINHFKINDIKYYKFKNSMQTILLSHQMIELFVDTNNIYYIMYNGNKYELYLNNTIYNGNEHELYLNNIHFNGFYTYNNSSTNNINLNNLKLNKHLIFKYNQSILIIIKSNNQYYYFEFFINSNKEENYDLKYITLNNIKYTVVNQSDPEISNQIKYIFNLIEGLYILLKNNNDYYICTFNNNDKPTYDDYDDYYDDYYKDEYKDKNKEKDQVSLFHNSGKIDHYTKNIILTKLIQVYENNIYIPDIQNIVEARCFYNFCIDTHDYNLYSLIFNKLKYFLRRNYYAGYFSFYYNDMYDKKYIDCIKKYYNIYSENVMFDFKTFLHYPSPNYLYTENNTLDKYIKFKLKQTNNITDDNIYRPIIDGITQETIISNIVTDINNKNSKIYELIMGFGKSKFIIPYVVYFIKYIESSITSMDELISDDKFNKFNEIFIICPQHLVKDMFDILFKYIDLLPKNINLQQIINYNNNYEFHNGQITVMSDTVIKYILLKDSELLTKNTNRLLLVDEIDNLMDPVVSQFNLTIEMKNDMPFKKLIFNIIYDILIYMKNDSDTDIKEIFKKDSLFNIENELENDVIDYINLFKNIKEKDIFELVTKNNNKNKKIIILLNNFIKCLLFNTKCNKKIEDDNNIILLYLLKKIYNIIKQFNILIINKHYGFSHDIKDNSYYFAQPYIGLNIPSKDSVYNDFILTIIMTINLFINTDLRDQDIINIIDILYSSDNDTIKYYKLDDFLKKINILLYEQKIDYIKNKISIIDKDNLIRLYLNKYILNKITYIHLFKNTSFIEILNPHLYDTCIGFTGTTETIDLIPFINDKQIFNETYSIEKFKIDAYDALINTKSTSLTKYIKIDSSKELDENIIEIIKTNDNYQVIIDNGAFLRFKNIEEYVNIFLNICNKTHIVYFDNNHTAILKYKENDKLINIDYNNNIELLKDKKYLIFFDINHCRGTDIKLPKCHGLLTLNNFNLSVDTLQSLYRLRNINHDDENKRQTVDYIYANINEENIKDIKKYLYQKTINYNKSKRKEFYKQCINSDIKIFKQDDILIYKSDEIQSFIYPTNLNELEKKISLLNKDLENKYYYKLLCKEKNNNCNEYNKLIYSQTKEEQISFSQSYNYNKTQNQSEVEVENQAVEQTEIKIINNYIKYSELKSKYLLNNIKSDLNNFKIDTLPSDVILYQKYMYDKIK